MDTSYITLYIPLFYLVAQIAALRSMPGRWQTAAVVPVFFMSAAVATYIFGMLFNLPNPAILVTMGIPASAMYLALLWTSYMFLRPNVEA
ncbi:MAG: hypothetical protein HRU32_15330 [Rhodobacteraceae bacterium]|nr:hypothetical protein [Paracoccaceae bacterium]